MAFPPAPKRSRNDLAKEIDSLVENVNPRAKVPLSIGLWSQKMQIMWLSQNQKKAKKPVAKKTVLTDDGRTV